MPTLRRDQYVEVGPACAPFESNITLQEAEDLRQVVVWDFFNNMPVHTPELTETSDKTMAAKAFHDTGGALYEAPSTFAGAMLRHIDEASWRMIIMQTKLRRARHNNAQQRIETRFNIEVFDDQLVEATRKMRIARGVGELTADAVERQMEEDVEDGYVVMQRRAYERYLTSDDCQRATEFLRSAVKQAAALRRLP